MYSQELIGYVIILSVYVALSTKQAQAVVVKGLSLIGMRQAPNVILRGLIFVIALKVVNMALAAMQPRPAAMCSKKH